MTLKRTYTDYLRDILDAAEKAVQFTQGMDFARFVAEERTNTGSVWLHLAPGL
jgi:uncharacterized protein with HEPN domain